MTFAGWVGTARRIAPLAWPVFIGQVAVLAFGTIDTVMAARASPDDLAALAIGGATYITIFIALMGVVLGVSPLAGQLFGAGMLHECGAQLQQAAWLALIAAVPGCLLLVFPQPILALAQPSAAVAERAAAHLAGLAVALPFALLFTAFRGFNNAVSRPKIVMVLQIAALVLKLPLTAWFVFGSDLPWGGALEPMGAAGCGRATALCMVLQASLAAWCVRRDFFYAPFGLQGRWPGPDWQRLRALARLGLPIGASIWIEILGFSSMAFFISRFGTTPMAAHQIALNLVSTIFMMPLSIGNAASTLVAQRIGAGDLADARRVGWQALEIGLALATAVGLVVLLLREPLLRLYTPNPAVVAAAMPLLAWVVVFHVADAGQTVAAFVLRAWRITLVPLLIYVVALWGIGLAGGYVLAFDSFGVSPADLHGAAGYWSAATAGLAVAAGAMGIFLARMLARQRLSQATVAS